MVGPSSRDTGWLSRAKKVRGSKQEDAGQTGTPEQGFASWTRKHETGHVLASCATETGDNVMCRVCALCI